MLIVKTEVREVEGKGVGLFADQYILKGNVIWRFSFPDIKIISKNLDTFDSFTQDFLNKYSWEVDDGLIVSGDNTRFINHSGSPNTTSSDLKIIALEDIQKGEEITCNYYELCNYVNKHGLGF